MRRKILALNFFPAFLPPSNGGVERVFRVYSELAKQFDVTLITSTHVNSARSEVLHAPGFREIRIGKDVHFEDCYVELARVAGEGDLSGPALALSTRQFGPLHSEYLQHHVDADIIIHDSPFLIDVDLFRGFDGKPRIYQSYNVETVLYTGFHSNVDRERRIESLVRELEQDTCKHADLITVCSAEDGEAFARLFDPAAAIVTCPNGFTPKVAGKSLPERRTDSLLFLGSAHLPNIEAATLISEEIAPQLPEFEFHLVGGCAPKGRRGNVISHGYVDAETKRSLLAEAGAALNPMISGSGSSLKIADFADSGLPLLSTAMGARGFDLIPGEHYVRLSAGEIVAEIKSAMSSPAELRRLGERSRKHFRERFTWEKIGQDFAARIEAVCSRDPAPKPRLVINDYDSFGGIGGGATRTRGLCRGLSETAPVIFLAFAEGADPVMRRVELDGRALVLLLPKTAEHVAEHVADDEAHWVSTADLVNYRHAAQNAPLLDVFAAAAAVSSVVVCEHPYIVGLPRALSIDFVYSSQNFELALKRSVLADHPRKDVLIAAAEEAEAFACGASLMIVAVSDDDARQLGGHYRFSAPIMLVPNGSEPPTLIEDENDRPVERERPKAIFMGSAHQPNIEAAKWINDELAALLPDVDFLIVGSVGSCLSDPQSNVEITGMVDADEKSRLLYSADVAINPMANGSGSNIKVADFLQHGLPVLSTPFGARGYETLPEEDIVLADLDGFAAALELVEIAAPIEARHERAKRYGKSLSMVEGGRQLARLLGENMGDRRRALYVTYRYNERPLGGGEAYVVRLAHALARSGWYVDVVSPAAERIDNTDRFGAVYSGPDFQPVPVGHSRVRSGKFAIDSHPQQADVEKLWSVQSSYEEASFGELERPTVPALAWGWSDLNSGGRWSYQRSAINIPTDGNLRLKARALGRVWLQAFTDGGELLVDQVVDEHFTTTLAVPAGLLEFRISLLEEPQYSDPRPLGVFFDQLDFGGEDLLQQSGQQAAINEAPAKIFAAYERARNLTRDHLDVGITDVRLGSKQLLRFVEENIGNYDAVITHNAVFGEATGAIRIADEAKVPSIFLPHLHYDDDFYHFSDVLEACAKATATLVSPRELTRFLRGQGLHNLHDHSPGIDTDVSFTPEDGEAFRHVLGSEDPFILVLGRKAPAKRYLDVITAAESLEDGPMVVLIGPDDDGTPIVSKRAIYLGPQPNEVVRGALRECLAVANMSMSESFGIVLLEAGLAGKPVLANKACAAFTELVEHGRNGYLVGPEDLATSMAKIAKDEELRLQLGHCGRAKALAYDWRRMEEEFVALCNAVVPGR